jgi:thiamine-monophosphate kinase
MTGIELQLVDWLRARERRRPGVLLGIGDDMAAVHVPSNRICLASDMLLDGVHFRTDQHEPSGIGRKAIACCLSDCAAMAVSPLAAVVSVALPPAWDLSRAQALFEGMFLIADEFEMAIVGGDTTCWNHPLVIDVAVSAVPIHGIEPVLRSGALIGDGIYVTGPLGGSLSGRHLTFTPRVREARVLAETLGRRLHAMMDLSDGLSLDLWRMCVASGVGAVLDENRLTPVISKDALRMANGDSRAAMERALSDGEDFELLLAVSPDGPPVESTGGVPIHRVGTVVPRGLWIERMHGTREVLQPRGYVH